MNYLISGAGTGIGRAIAQKLASAGASVILCGRNTGKLEEARQDLDHPSRHTILEMDVRDRSKVEKAVASLKIAHLDGIVANAGIGGSNEYGPSDRWQEVLDTNLSGTYHVANAGLSLLRKSPSEYRHVVVMSSVLARLGVAAYSAYCASKAGLLGLTRSWAVAWAPEKILVNAICPGWVNTKMASDGIEGIAKATDRDFDEAYKAAMSAVPLRKMSEPEEVADLVFYLLNQRSMTGQTLDINGGSVMNS